MRPDILGHLVLVIYFFCGACYHALSPLNNIFFAKEEFFWVIYQHISLLNQPMSSQNSVPEVQAK